MSNTLNTASLPSASQQKKLIEELNQCLRLCSFDADNGKAVVAKSLDTSGRAVDVIMSPAGNKSSTMSVSGSDSAVLSSLMLIIPGILDDVVEAAMFEAKSSIEALSDEVSSLSDDMEEAKADIANLGDEDREQLCSSEFKPLIDAVHKAELMLVRAESDIRSGEYNSSIIDMAVQYLRAAEDALKLSAPSTLILVSNKLQSLRDNGYIVFNKLYSASDKLAAIASQNLFNVAASILDATPIVTQTLISSRKDLVSAYEYIKTQLLTASSGAIPGKKIVALGRIRDIREAIEYVVNQYRDYINPVSGTFLKRTRNGALLSTILVKTAQTFDVVPEDVNIIVNKAIARLHKSMWSAQARADEAFDVAMDALSDVTRKCNKAIGYINQYGPEVTRSAELLGNLLKGDFDSVGDLALNILSITGGSGKSARINVTDDIRFSVGAGEFANFVKRLLGSSGNDISDYLQKTSESSLRNAVTSVSRMPSR